VVKNPVKARDGVSWGGLCMADSQQVAPRQ
jgi:hypothetical protein